MIRLLYGCRVFVRHHRILTKTLVFLEITSLISFMSRLQSSALLIEVPALGGGCSRTLLRVPPTNLVCSSYLKRCQALCYTRILNLLQIKSRFKYDHFIARLHKRCDGTKNRLGATGMDRNLLARIQCSAIQWRVNLR